MSRSTRFAVVGGLAIGAFALSACSPVMTNEPYDASDGVGIAWSEDASLEGVNLMVLTSEEGAEGRILGAFSNSSSDDTAVEFGFTDGEMVVLDVPASSTVLMNGTEDVDELDGDLAISVDVLVPEVPSAPGSTVEMVFAATGQGMVSVEVPVLDGTLPEYEELVP